MGQPTNTRGIRIPARVLTKKVLTLGLLGAGLTIATSFIAAQWLHSAEESAVPPPPVVESRPIEDLFRDWPANRKPDVVLVLSGQEHGYLQPCGCSKPQLGGLVRR